VGQVISSLEITCIPRLTSGAADSLRASLPLSQRAAASPRGRADPRCSLTYSQATIFRRGDRPVSRATSSSSVHFCSAPVTHSTIWFTSPGPVKLIPCRAFRASIAASRRLTTVDSLLPKCTSNTGSTPQAPARLWILSGGQLGVPEYRRRGATFEVDLRTLPISLLGRTFARPRCSVFNCPIARLRSADKSGSIVPARNQSLPQRSLST
jgi:hypothetical protein